MNRKEQLEEPTWTEAGRRLSEKAGRVIWVGSRLWYIDPDRVVLGWLDDYGTHTITHLKTGVEVRVYVRDPA